MSKSLRIFQDHDSFCLDAVSVASPCSARWNDMVGSERVRFCGACQKNVFNLSGMRRDEAVELLQASQGKACVRFFRRADGTVLTEDCPIGVALVVRRAKRATLAAAAVVVGAFAALLAGFVGWERAMVEAKRNVLFGSSETGMVEVVPPAPAAEFMGGALMPEPHIEVLGEVAVPQVADD